MMGEQLPKALCDVKERRRRSGPRIEPEAGFDPGPRSWIPASTGMTEKWAPQADKKFVTCYESIGFRYCFHGAYRFFDDRRMIAKPRARESC